MTKFKPDILVYGGPGSGKSTQTEMLVKKLHADHLNMGGELRKFVTTKHRDAALTKKVMLTGKLVPVRVSNGIAEKFVSQLPASHQIVFDGYPRSMAQVSFLDKLLTKLNRPSIMIYIKLPMTVARERLLKRAKIDHRADDMDPKALTARIKVFQHEAKELLAYYRQSKRLITINGNQTMKQVQADIINALKAC
jgi:adenylate kinase